MAENRVIGDNNRLPWKLPADLAWFKKNTLNKPIVMGRKTWESLPFKPLPGRDNIIISRDLNFQPKNNHGKEISSAIVCSSVAHAIEYADKKAYEELMFIGGAMLYSQVLEIADCLYLTLIKGNIKGDAWFPEIDYSLWKQYFSEQHSPDEDNPHYYSFNIYSHINKE